MAKKGKAKLPASKWAALLSATYAQAGDPDIAVQQARYMKDQFDFYGCKHPIWRGLLRDLLQTYELPTGETLHRLVHSLYDTTYRELHYTAVELVKRAQKKRPSVAYIKLIEWMILERSWWDTVDALSKMAGTHFLLFPDDLEPYTTDWISNTDEMWLQRAALLYQLDYKDLTNQTKLFDNVIAVADSSEFFLRKGAGWALRQYSKIEPYAVQDFVADHPELSNLTKREATRLLKNYL